MKKLFAIGGGEIGARGTSVETLAIDREIIRQSDKKRPRLLFIPTASKDASGYIEAVEKHFGKHLKCKVDSLLLLKNPPLKVIRAKILGADIIYVGGGNTKYLLKKWKHFKVGKLLWQAFNKGAVISGLSAGANCWFKNCTSDSGTKPGAARKSYIRLSGLGWYPLTFSPHHIREQGRKFALIKQIKKYGGIGVAMDDYAALEIIGDKFKIITSKPKAKAHKVYKKNGKLFYEEIPQGKFLKIKKLATK